MLPGNEATNWIFIPIVGIVYFFVYYFVFKFAILKWDLKTPGRDEDDAIEGMVNNADDEELSVKIIDALGGLNNIEDIDACITRLRVSVKDVSLVQPNEFWKKELSAKGLMIKGTGVQAIYGSRAAILKSIISEQVK